MKELSIEEKALRYDEVFSMAKEWYNNPNSSSIGKSYLYAVLPELKESEDERIRENIIATIHLYYGEPLEDEAKEMIAWLERRSQTFNKKDIDDAYLKGLCDAKHEIEKQGERKPADKAVPFDEFEGLTDFERTLAVICIGWIGEELGWKQYIKDNADVLLKIAIKKFNSAQDVAFEQKPAELSQSEVTKTSDQVQKPAEWSLPYGKNETAEDHAYFAGSESQRVKLEKIKDNFIKKSCDAYCKVCKIPNCRSSECKLISDFKGHLEI